MMDFRLHVITALSQGRFEPPLSPTDFPQEVTGTLEDYSEGELPLPTDSATLLLTDRPELVRTLSANKPDRLHLVFIGSGGEAAGLEDALEDIWNPAEGPRPLKRRYKKLLTTLKNEFDLWFYKNALTATIDTVPDMLWYKRLDGIHMMVNDAFTGIVHKTKEDVVGKDHFYIWDAPRPAEGSADFACAESEEIAISSGKTYICDEPVKTREGLKQFTTYKTPVYDMFGNVFGTVGVGHDVTNFSNLGIELSILVENMPFPMTIFTPDWKVVRMNWPFPIWPAPPRLRRKPGSTTWPGRRSILSPTVPWRPTTRSIPPPRGSASRRTERRDTSPSTSWRSGITSTTFPATTVLCGTSPSGYTLSSPFSRRPIPTV